MRAKQENMMNGTSSSFNGRNYSDEERRLILAGVQLETTIIMAPSIVFLCLMFVTGAIGNSLVLYVYSRRFSRSPLRTYVKAAAVVDLLTNLIVIPGDVSDTFNWWDYDQPYFCKARRLVYAATSMSSALLLLCLAVARYRKVCRPFSRQVNMSHVKISMIFVIGLPIICSVPYALLHGRQSRMNPHPGVYVYFCSVDDSYVQTKWPMVHACFFLLLFLSCCIPLVVLYALIGAKAWRHKRSRMAAMRLKKPGNTDDIKSNTAAATATDDNSTSGKLDTVEQTKFDSTDQMITCDSERRLKESDFMTRDNNTKEGRIPRTGEKMRISVAESLRNDLETCRTCDRDKYVKRKCQSLQRNVDGEEFDVLGTRDVGGDGVQNPRIHTDDIISLNIHKHDVTNSEALLDDVIDPVTHSFDIKIQIQNCESTANGDDNLRENLGTFKPIDSVSQNIQAPPTIEFLPHTLTPTRELLSPLNATLSDGGASPLTDTPSSSLQRNQCLAVDLHQPRNDVHGDVSHKLSYLYSVREKGVHSLRMLDRTTCMLLAITLVFMFAYIPFISLELIKYAAPGVFAPMRGVSLAVYNLFWRSYLVNSCANPIIYSLYDLRFRRESLKILSNVLPFKKKK